jgi:hypothetical protein
VLRRSLLLPAVLVAVALPVAPALAGEDDGGDDDASLRQARNCVTDASAKVTVRGDDIDSVAFFVDGDLEKTARETNRGTFVFKMSCSHLSVGAHRARAAVTFSGDTSPSQTLRFTITRAAQGSPRFTG